MEKELNIANILQDKPEGTLLHSDIYGRCKFWAVEDDNVRTMSDTHINGRTYSGTEVYLPNGKVCDEGKVQLFPSDKMRDWSKFGWTKGTILRSAYGKALCVFLGWEDDDYLFFKSAYKLEFDEADKVKDWLKSEDSLATLDYVKEEDEASRKDYIKKIEQLFGGSFNQDTCVIEKPTYNVGDVLVAIQEKRKFIFILDSINQSDDRDNTEEIDFYAAYEVNNHILSYNKYFYSDTFKEIRLADKEEKKLLEINLGLDCKRWNPETMRLDRIESQRCKLFPFQQVLVRDNNESCWFADIFSHFLPDYDGKPMYRTSSGWYEQCISYAEHEELIGTNLNVES